MSEARELVEQVTDPDKEEFGPAMAACSSRERAFVLAFLDGKSAADAARKAGYGNAESSSHYFASIAYRLLHKERITKALSEEVPKRIRHMAPDALRAVHETVNDRANPQRLKAAEGILGRIDPKPQRVEGQVQHLHEIRNHTKEQLAQYRQFKAEGRSEQFLLEWFGPNGLDRMRRLAAVEDATAKDSAIVDAEFTEVTRDPDADLLGE